jgi:hypothetical protein
MFGNRKKAKNYIRYAPLVEQVDNLNSMNAGD